MSVVPVVLRLAARLVAPVVAICAVLWVLAGFFDDKPLIGETIEVAQSATSAVEVPAPQQGQPAAPAAATVEAAAPPEEAMRRTSESELDAALADTLSGTEGVKSRAVVSRFGVLVAVSAKLPENANGFGDYVNIRLTVRPEAEGLEVTRMAVGRYEIPRRWIGPALKMSMDWLPGADQAAELLANIDSVDPWGKSVTFAPEPAPAQPTNVTPTPSAG